MVLSAKKETALEFPDQHVSEIKIGPMKTGIGVAIGDSIVAAQKILGGPTRSGRIDKWDMQVMRYIYETKKDREGVSDRYEGVYTFVNGKLVTIQLYQDVMGGP